MNAERLRFCARESFLRSAGILMVQPWRTIDKADTPDGILELRQRGERDFLILINNRVLMNSSANRSEIALGRVCGMLAGREKPRVLLGGLGMGLTLRAVLELLPSAAEVIVAELNPVVVKWCRGPLAPLTQNAAEDPRVTFVIEDVSRLISKAATQAPGRLDAVIIDLYEGPHAKTDAADDPFYGAKALQRTFAVLRAGGVFGVWGEAPDAGFEWRLRSAGFSVDFDRPGRGGLRHVVYAARKN
jgi:spermidine synthase